jgi:hypothetical protein
MTGLCDTFERSIESIPTVFERQNNLFPDIYLKGIKNNWNYFSNENKISFLASLINCVQQLYLY